MRDQRRDPVQQRHRRRPDMVEHAALAGPDADRDQHHVAGGKTGDRQRPHQHPAGAILRRGQGRHIERYQPIAEGLDPPDQMVGVCIGTAPGQAQPASGHVDAAGQHRRLFGQHRFDQPDAGAALQPVDGQRQFLGAIRFSNDMPGEVPAFRRFRPQRAGAGGQQALAVVAAEPQALDDVAGGGAAGAAESAPRRRRQAAMRADRVRGTA